MKKYDGGHDLRETGRERTFAQSRLQNCVFSAASLVWAHWLNVQTLHLQRKMYQTIKNEYLRTLTPKACKYQISEDCSTHQDTKYELMVSRCFHQLVLRTNSFTLSSRKSDKRQLGQVGGILTEVVKATRLGGKLVTHCGKEYVLNTFSVSAGID